MTTHIPAWKRLGLKLKYAKDDTPPVQPLHPMTTKQDEAADFEGVHSEPRKRRKITRAKNESHTPSQEENQNDEVGPVPRTSTTARQTAEVKSLKQKKRVSFSAESKAADTTASSVDGADDVGSPASLSVKKPASPKTTGKNVRKSNNSLDYLRQYQDDRSTWKFNKTRQTWIIKHALSTEDIPTELNLALVQYIHGLKSEQARSRLAQQCKKETSRELLSSLIEPQRISDRERHFLDSLEEASSVMDGETGDFEAWAKDQPRTRLLLLSLNEPSAAVFDEHQDSASTRQNGHALQEPTTNGTSINKSKRKQSKTRTAVIDLSSSSESDSDGEDGNNARTHVNGSLLNRKSGMDQSSADDTTSSEGSISEDD